MIRSTKVHRLLSDLRIVNHDGVRPPLSLDQIVWFSKTWCLLLFLNLIQFTIAMKVIYQVRVIPSYL